MNDVNHHICNFWRAIRHDPEAVAESADWPVNEADMHAIHRWLVLGEEAAAFARRVREDPDYFDAKRAGRWAWGMCCWIGSGWCDVGAAEVEKLPRLTNDVLLRAGGHLSEQVPRLSAEGQGINVPDKRPLLAGPADEHGERTQGLGLNAKGPVLSQKMPRLAGGHKAGDLMYSGYLIHAEKVPDSHRPQLADAYARGRGVNGNDSAGTCAERRAWLIDWFGRLADRLRTVRVCCGHWRRTCDSPSVTTRLGTTGVLLDPPYPTHAADGTESRSGGLYASDGDRDELDKLRDEVLAWCREYGPDPEMRIVVCGYDTDGYAALEAEGWECVAWRSSGGYGNRSEKGRENAGRERIWYSPHCVKPDDDMPLFGALQ